MAVTIQQTEAIPAAWPSVDPYPHRQDEIWEDETETNTVDAGMIWARIEAYTAHRFAARNVVWIVEGSGEWTPPLTPATVSTVEAWADGNGWQTITPTASPLGGYLFDGFGPYRVSASVGSGTVPEAVQEAYRRLYEYSKGIANQFRGDAAYSGGDEGPAYAWTAKAMQLSGAADLLRPYRRA